VWIVGGDGWAYDIGSSGVDHVLASGRDVNILVMDTEVYSNTGGQMSKSTPMGAVAKFAAAASRSARRTCVAGDFLRQCLCGAHRAGRQSAADPVGLPRGRGLPGPSLILAYSHCIAHGINMQRGLDQQHLAVESGHWPLFRYNPAVRESGENPFVLDSGRPKIPLKNYAYNEVRYKVLAHTNPKEAEHLMDWPSRRSTGVGRCTRIWRPAAAHVPAEVQTIKGARRFRASRSRRMTPSTFCTQKELSWI
jgi:pyruvate-ferredoxin/flavodoxin oxidoreductase